MKELIQGGITTTRMDSEAVAKAMGVGRTTSSARLNKQHTDEWTLSEIRGLCSKLQIEIDPDEAPKICRALGITIRKEAAVYENRVRQAFR